MRRLALTAGMLLMGLALVGGASTALAGSILLPLDQQVGTHASAAGAVLGIGLIAAAFNPSAHLLMVRIGALYGFVVLVFETGSAVLWHTTFHIGPVLVGLAFSLLLIAAYPERRQLVPARSSAPPSGKATPPPKEPEASEPPKESDSAPH